jgi:acetyl esterase
MSNLDPAIYPPTGTPAPLDPQIAEFSRRMAQDASRFPRRDTVSLEEGRAIAEQVRAPWAQGGPVMATTVEHDVATAQGPARLRVYTPQNLKLGGVFIYIHGGGYVLFSNDTHDRLMRVYAHRAGIVVVGIEYRRAPELRFPGQSLQCLELVRWIVEHRQTLGYGTGKVFLGGDSAGANLSAGIGVALRAANQPIVDGLILNYGGYGSNMNRASVIRYGAGDYGLSAHMMLWFRGLYLTRVDDYSDPRYNLLNADVRGLPPVLQVITECDPLYDDNLDFEKKLKDAGVDVTARIYPGTVHSFLEAVSIADVANRAFDETAAWIADIAARAAS